MKNSLIAILYVVSLVTFPNLATAKKDKLSAYPGYGDDINVLEISIKQIALMEVFIERCMERSGIPYKALPPKMVNADEIDVYAITKEELAEDATTHELIENSGVSQLAYNLAMYGEEDPDNSKFDSVMAEVERGGVGCQGEAYRKIIKFHDATPEVLDDYDKHMSDAKLDKRNQRIEESWAECMTKNGERQYQSRAEMMRIINDVDNVLNRQDETRDGEQILFVAEQCMENVKYSAKKNAIKEEYRDKFLKKHKNKLDLTLDKLANAKEQLREHGLLK